MSNGLKALLGGASVWIILFVDGRLLDTDILVSMPIWIMLPLAFSSAGLALYGLIKVAFIERNAKGRMVSGALLGAMVLSTAGYLLNEQGMLPISQEAEFVSACKTAKHRPTHRLLGGQRITDSELTEMCECMHRLLSSGENGDEAIDLILNLPAVRANGYYDPVKEMACYVPPK